MKTISKLVSVNLLTRVNISELASKEEILEKAIEQFKNSIDSQMFDDGSYEIIEGYDFGDGDEEINDDTQNNIK